MQHPVFAHNLQYPEDQKAILALEDLWIERPPEESRVFTIEFVSGFFLGLGMFLFRFAFFGLVWRLWAECWFWFLVSCPQRVASFN